MVFRKLRREKAMICEWWASDYGLVNQRSRKVYSIAALLSHRFLLYQSQSCANGVWRPLRLPGRLEPAISVRLISRHRNHKVILAVSDSQSGSPVTLPSEIRLSPTNPAITSCSLDHGFRSGSAATLASRLRYHLSCRRPSQKLSASQMAESGTATMAIPVKLSPSPIRPV